MICILHGYLLEGSGSNLWTRCMIQSLCRAGETVHLVCQENHPDIYDFISEVYRYHPDGNIETVIQRNVAYKGKCIMHKPDIGDTLPVYVWDEYEEFEQVVPMVKLGDAVIERYIQTNVDVLSKVVKEYGIKSIIANHAVLMSVVAQRVGQENSVPYAIMPHGSAMEYAVAVDERFRNYATDAFNDAERIFYIGPDVKSRILRLFESVQNLEKKLVRLHLGVDTSLFEPVEPDNRVGSIEELKRIIRDIPRGKTPTLSIAALKSSLKGRSLKEVQSTIAASSKYNARLPDDDLEDKLNTIDWKNDKIILFVGRIISNKGLHAVIAAMPEILSKHSNAKLVVVGHGPLREAVELMIFALRSGDKNFIKNAIEWGSALEGRDRKPFDQLKAYFDVLEREGRMDEYFDHAVQYLDENTVVFTGYLTHKELKLLFPCCDTGVFPSLTKEAGPLVFLEAVASGIFPVGTYFGGMADNINFISNILPQADAELMRLSIDDNRVVSDLVASLSGSLNLNGKHRKALRDFAVSNYDWSGVSENLISEMEDI